MRLNIAYSIGIPAGETMREKNIIATQIAIRIKLNRSLINRWDKEIGIKYRIHTIIPSGRRMSTREIITVSKTIIPKIMPLFPENFFIIG